VGPGGPGRKPQPAERQRHRRQLPGERDRHKAARAAARRSSIPNGPSPSPSSPTMLPGAIRIAAGRLRSRTPLAPWSLRPWLRLPPRCRSRRSPPPGGVPTRLRGRANDRTGPAPSDTRSPRSRPRRSRFPAGRAGMRSKDESSRPPRSRSAATGCPEHFDKREGGARLNLKRRCLDAGIRPLPQSAKARSGPLRA
jgi:hypothetical protein